MTIFVLFLEFTAGELLTPFCRSAFQARIAAESRSYGKNFCNDRVEKRGQIYLAGFVTLRVHKSPSGINLSRLCRE